MPKKNKIVLIIVAIVAVFLLYKLTEYISVAAGQNYIKQNTPLPSADEDPDHDGLSNKQEVIWGSDPFNPDSDGDGFKDGEEVDSGHSPLIPGPNDLINSDNLTDQFSELAVAGLVAGDLQPESENYAQALSQITSEVADSATFIFNPEVKLKSLNIIKETEQANKRYVSESAVLLRDLVSGISLQFINIQKNMDRVGISGFGDKDVIKFYSGQKDLYSNLFKVGVSIKVPEPFAESHAQLLSIIQKMENISKAVQNGEKDPVKAALALENLGTILETLADYAVALDKAIEKSGADASGLNLLSQ